jgi:NAD(P)-dependent dehydrogenase (short-subunit alcohol dehydrogenase family)
LIIEEAGMADSQGRGAVLVTGATGGIGATTVEALSRRGFTVYAGVRRTSRDSTVREVLLDVADPASVAAAAEQVAAEVGGLRAVVNNAGVIVQGPIELVPADEWRRQFEVNTFGPASVVREFLPLVRAGAGRIVNVSAPTGRVAFPLLGALSASKAGLEALSNALRLELAAWKIPVVVVEPGSTATAIFEKAGAAEQEARTRVGGDRVALYRPHLDAYAKASARFKPGPVEKVAEVIVRAVEAPRPKRRYTVGDARTLGAVLTRLPAGLRDKALSNALGLSGIKA